MQRGEICTPEYASNNNDKQLKCHNRLQKRTNCQKGGNLMHEGKNKTTPSQIRGGKKRPNATRPQI